MQGFWIKLYNNDYELDCRFADSEEEANTVAIEMLQDCGHCPGGTRIVVNEGYSND